MVASIGFIALFVPVLVGAQVSDINPESSQWIHPFNIKQPSTAPSVMLALVEIPADSRVKYEIDPSHGALVVDRILPPGYAYPAAYGGLPSWPVDDGDLMDVLIITQTPLLPGSLISVMPIGMAWMEDGGVADHKVLAIPVSEVPQRQQESLDIDVIAGDKLAEIEHFYRSYKQRPDGSNPIDWGGYRSRQAVGQSYCDSLGLLFSKGLCVSASK